MNIATGDDVAFCHSLNRMSGTKTDGEQMDVWVRESLCFRKIDGEWKITHQHESVPMYMDGSIRAAIDLSSHLDREDLELYGQKIVTYFHSTDTWAKQDDGNWRRAATPVMAIPNERKPAKVDPKTLDSYVGQYQLSPEVFYTITREGDRIFGQRTGRAKEELLPLCGDIFFKKGVWRGEKVFERDSGGKVIKLLDRRENNDLVWKKVK